MLFKNWTFLPLATAIVLCIAGFNWKQPTQPTQLKQLTQLADKQQLTSIAEAKRGSYPIKTKHLDENGRPVFVNRLIQQDSLYLLQHAHNPVNWYSWSDQAFAAARKQDKPILLSIGYSTCHWCHVMERESFEDEQIAAYLNEHYIAIKVDREERPDIDELYLTAVQMLSGKAGWPLTVVLTPDAKPFFGGTYFAPEQFLSKLEQINTTWKNNREAVNEQGERLHVALTKLSRRSASANKIDAQLIADAVGQIAGDMKLNRDGPLAGFPREPETLFLLQQAKLNLDPATIELLNQRLTTIIRGGIYDQLGGGFHRYTVDAQWQIPHFEKMLYNQAQMSEALIAAYQLSGNTELLDAGLATLDFVLRDMQHPNGGFYSAMDAESGGEEGGYYLWSISELESLLTPKQLQVAKAHFGLSAEGNFNGKNILHINEPQNGKTLESLIKVLQESRGKRKIPKIDTKRITAWNGLMIKALMDGFDVTSDQRYLDAATKAAKTLWQTAFTQTSGLARVVHSTANDRTTNAQTLGNPIFVAGVLDDYANFALALLAIYDQSQDPKLLSRAVTVADKMIEKMFSQESGAFNVSAQGKDEHQDPNLLVNLITARDDALNSGNSVAAQLLLRLHKRTGQAKYRRLATSVLAAFSKQLVRSPQTLSGMLNAASLLHQGDAAANHYAANNKVKIRSELINDQLQVDMDIEHGWHINSYRVFEGDLIATALSADTSQCPSILKADYPQDKIVTLGFQTDELIVYEGTTRIMAKIDKLEPNKCRVISSSLRLQACSDQVCLQPETLEIRTPIPRK